MGVTVEPSQSEITSTAAPSAKCARPPFAPVSGVAPAVRERLYSGTSMMSAATAASAINTRCDCCVPMAAMSTRLATNAPTIAPMVFAAYTVPTKRPVSR